jgi:hypothetical protein
VDPDPRIHASDPDPPIFVTDLHEAKKQIKKSFSAYYFLKVHLYHFSKIKSQKEVAKQYRRNQGFSYYFYLMIAGSGAMPLMDPDPGGPKTYGSDGSGSATLLFCLVNVVLPGEEG